MSKHTPGPWRVEIDDSPDAAWAWQWPTIVSDEYEVVGTEGLYGDLETDMANARLIAAAPELLVALQLMVDRFLDTEGSYGVWENEAIEAARAAIAKATGGEG